MGDAFAAFLALVQPGVRALLTTHVGPDGDGIGSELALAALLRTRGAEVRIVNADPTPRTLMALPGAATVEVYDPAVHDAFIEQAELLIGLDNSVPERFGALAGPLLRSRGTRVCVDHHPHPDGAWDQLVIDSKASCTAELVHALYAQAEMTPESDAAQALYAALVSDTGRFRFGNASGAAFRMAASLVELGVRPDVCHGQLEEQLSEGFLRLYGEVLSEMEVRADGALVLLRVTREHLARHGVNGEDLSEIVNRALAIRSSRIAVLVRELDASRTKFSLRSKGTLDVNALARRHGGGGHRNASGIVIDAPLEDAIARITSELDELARS